MSTQQPAHPAAPPAGPGRPRGALAASYIWAAAPILTLGFGTWAVFLYAAVRTRSIWLGAWAALYAALLVVLSVAFSPKHPGTAEMNIGLLAWLGCTLGGSAHAFGIRKRVLGGRDGRPDDALRQAQASAEQRRKLRDEARALAARDPALARELGIGRPDLNRDYDDGGLVDVNHCPAPVLATLPGITPALAARVVQIRQDRGGFVSADDLSSALGLPPGDVSYLADRTIYPA